ncbi:hypothetical protein TrLO_g13534 [Triparma laevis f. longispina]|uniref:Uncharacterized protein n=1 Tax=Triparma laevis f. longispina TaxID=1714387 RepID=A0A9W7FRX4_9STRA|nr:hypothetical protein TrLO_g13534 [Triparma laevis f. longispina]
MSETLFAELWLLHRYEKIREHKASLICEVWKNLDGSKSLQYTRSTSLPGGFQDRLFETWFTWDVVENGDGTRTFIIGFAPLEEYRA